MRMPQGVSIKEYIGYLAKQDNSNILNDELKRALISAADIMDGQPVHEIIIETELQNENISADLSVRFDIDDKDIPVKEYWLEMDYNNGFSVDDPCKFIDASFITPKGCSDENYEKIIRKFAGDNRADTLRETLKSVSAALDGKCSGLYQLGTMDSRGQLEGLRIFTDGMSKNDLADYLAGLDWKGDIGKLVKVISAFEECAVKGKFILDHDISADGISDKIGINFGIRYASGDCADKAMETLAGMGMCCPSKRNGVIGWLDTPPYYEPFMQNSLSHFKIAFSGDSITSAKVYLQINDRCFNRKYRYYFSPVLMNMEVTSKCPLNCPQCYASVNSGEELPFDKAVSRLKEAAECGVRFINISGGETLCYPYLDDMIRECVKLGLSSAVSLSGACADKIRLKQLIESGVDEVYVSLNGSTEEINSITRDGYTLAVNALKNLKELGFENTAVNWVMHSENADDFEKFVSFCEGLGVKRIVILGYKPTAEGKMDGYPTAEQLMRLCAFIKSFSGNIELKAESCFSQLCALLGRGLFGNINTGIAKGCGAGRDGISVNVRGQLTPCRHLDIAEDGCSVMEYWRNSRTLKSLRATEDSRGEPCSVCSLKDNCLPCADIGRCLYGDINSGIRMCPLKEKFSDEQLILVDMQDRETGSDSKESIHRQGLLHRAFSVFLFDGDRLLIQKRAVNKYHSGGAWANTCCSHQRKGEALTDAAHRRLRQECGIDTDIHEAGSFVYRTEFKNGLIEFEYDHVFIGSYCGEFAPDKEEIEIMKFENVETVMEDIRSCPQKYAPWFITALGIAYEAYRSDDQYSTEK